MEAIINTMKFEPGPLADAIKKRLRSMEQEHVIKRIGNRDATLWKDDEETTEMISHSLGWLDLASNMASEVPHILQFVHKVQAVGLTHAVVIGMGGGIMALRVFKQTFETGKNGLDLSIVDTTDPATIQAEEQKISFEKTLFIISDKSGKTAETDALSDYFYKKLKAVKGEKAGDHFAAITDAGTPLVEKARALHYRGIFLNPEGIADGYTALSYVGIVPAALMGLDVKALWGRAMQMEQSCQTGVISSENPALKLGAIMGEMAIQKRDKLTLVLPDRLSAFGIWLEALIAGSTGQEGKGILPISGEALLNPEFYRDDRLFVHLHLKGEHQPEVTEQLQKLTEAGHPLVTIGLEDKWNVVGEFYRWQMAVAVTGSIIGINVFDQPNVRESERRTNQILSKFEKEGVLPLMNPAITEGSLTFFTYRNKFRNAEELLDLFMNGEHGGDYIAIQAFLPEDARTDQILQEFRLILQQRLKRATTVGYGPRYLHSTGQFHKGGPNNGLFVQLTANEEAEVNVPGKNYSFGTFKRAQADGDFTLMWVHSRRIIRVDLNGDIHEGMTKLIDLVTTM